MSRTMMGKLGSQVSGCQVPCFVLWHCVRSSSVASNARSRYWSLVSRAVRIRIPDLLACEPSCGIFIFTFTFVQQHHTTEHIALGFCRASRLLSFFIRSTCNNCLTFRIQCICAVYPQFYRHTLPYRFMLKRSASRGCASDIDMTCISVGTR